MSEIKVRNAEMEMIPFIREQRMNAYSQYAKVLPADHWKALKKALSSNADSQPEVELIVAELDKKVVGSVVLFPAKSDAYEGYIDELDYPEIRMLAVSTEARGKGVASALVSECMERSKAKGFKAIGLHTGEFMKDAISLYEQFGFERIPQFDFEPAGDGVIVRAYVLNFK
jgi:ribosomal protein S18 acetylase RimI-like enzyme